jgi:hypothetical protein
MSGRALVVALSDLEPSLSSLPDLPMPTLGGRWERGEGHTLVFAPGAPGLSIPLLLVVARSVHTALLIALAPKVGGTHVVRPSALLVASGAFVVGFGTLQVVGGTLHGEGEGEGDV